MPAGRGRLRTAIDDWMETGSPARGIRGWWERVNERYLAWAEAENILRTTKPGVYWGHFLTLGVCAIGYVFFGWQGGMNELQAEIAGEPIDTISNLVANGVADVFSHPGFREAANIIGAFIVDSVVSVLEQEAEKPDPDPKAFARTFHGLMASLTLSGGILDTTIETITGGQIEGAGRMMQSIYWNLGLGFLGWQTLAPLLSAGLQPNLERYYQEKYRPTRFTAAELRDLYALGKISPDEMRTEAGLRGWRDEDIEKWIDLAFRNLSETDVWAAYHKGKFTEGEAVRRLRSLGYSPDDIPLLFELNPADDLESAESVTLTTAKQSFSEQLIGEDEFRGILADLDKGPREIELMVQLVRHQQEEAIKRLTIGQLKEAWELNQVTDAEVSHWLSEEDYSQDQIGLILRTWKAGLEPAFRKLNKGTVISAYVEGVIDRTAAFRKLQEIGFADADARLELDLAEARSPEAFGRPAPALPKQLAPGTLSDLLQSGLIEAGEMRSRLIDLGYPESDADLLTQAAVLRFVGEPRPLTQLTVERAYLAGILTRPGALSRLLDLDFTAEAAETIIQTVEAENPAVFAPESIQSLRVPSVGALVEAVRAGIIDELTYYARMTEAGFDRTASEMYLNLAIQSERKAAKGLTVAQVLEAYSRDFITRSVAMSRLTSMGYNDTDATMLCRFEKSGIEDTEPWKLMLAGRISAEDTWAQLIGLGFTPEEIDKAVAGLSED